MTATTSQSSGNRSSARTDKSSHVAYGAADAQMHDGCLHSPELNSGDPAFPSNVSSGLPIATTTDMRDPFLKNTVLTALYTLESTLNTEHQPTFTLNRVVFLAFFDKSSVLTSRPFQHKTLIGTMILGQKLTEVNTLLASQPDGQHFWTTYACTEVRLHGCTEVRVHRSFTLHVLQSSSHTTLFLPGPL